VENKQLEVPQEIRSHRYPELDALRGLAASTVIFHHMLLIWNNAGWYLPLMATPLRLFFAGPQAVVLFFVLSGFVLSAAQNSPRRPGYFGYLIKRLCRIYLPYLAALLIACAFAWQFYLRTPTDNAWVNGTWSYRPILSQVLQAALTSMNYSQQFNTAFWSVLIEIRVSLVFPLLFLVVKRIPAWCSVALMLVLLATSPLIPNANWFQTMQAVTLFLFGTLAFLHLDKLRSWMAAQTRSTQIVLLLLSLVAYTYGNATIHFGPIHNAAITTAATTNPTVAAEAPSTGHLLHQEIKQGRYAMCAIASLLLMLGAIAQPGLRRFLQRPFLLRLGALSYSIYLIHGTVLFAMIRGLWGKIPVAAFVVLYVVLVYAAAELFHLLIDAPALQLGRRVGKSAMKHKQATA
jgi:peptidoglycan/LPS O-acetylase OafA/YrhL